MPDSLGVLKIQKKKGIEFMASNTAIQALTDRAKRLEIKDKDRRKEAKQQVQETFGLVSGVVGAVLGGYADGRLDARDGISGDGYNPYRIPVVPLAGAAVFVTGMVVGGTAGKALSMAGYGAVLQGAGRFGAHYGIKHSL